MNSIYVCEQEITSRGLDQFYHLEEACLTKKADLAAVLKLLQVLLPSVFMLLFHTQMKEARLVAATGGHRTCCSISIEVHQGQDTGDGCVQLPRALLGNLVCCLHI